MRYYFYDQNSEKNFVDLELHEQESGEIEIKFNEGTALLKKINTKHFISFDQIRWQRIFPIFGDNISIQNLNHKIYRGYFPSGVNQGSEGGLISQMPGKIVKVFIKPGDKVEKGDVVLVMEAMKMENEVKSSVSGKVESVLVSEGQAVESGQVLVEIN
ncbi:acetyl-CoA carboxylase biotin carboxyl carrier protein subunit [Bacteriovoracaceae bacterium]|nr:acetyl-CoA carboxylase biotin carboxyl carrier protein subunit [Bacteriovoracaceae bacterium]